jgi:hypothetical protein
VQHDAYVRDPDCWSRSVSKSLIFDFDLCPTLVLYLSLLGS